MAFEIFDDTAFYWFLETILTITFVPYILWAYVVHPFKRKLLSGPLSCKCSLCKKPKKKIQKPISLFYILTKLAQLALCVFYVKVLVFLILNGKEEDLAHFNPFEILDLAESATASEIKKRYYKLSLEYHPDKQKGKLSTEIAKKYILIKKAYQSLTDETARKNFETHGHPDGSQGMSVTIGLPSFLTAKENELAVLVAYVGLLILFVSGVIYWWKRSVKYNRQGVQNQTAVTCAINTEQDSTAQNFLEILSFSKEFKIFENKTPKEFAGLFALAKKHCRISKNNYLHFVNYAWTVFVCHLGNKEFPESMRNDHLFVTENAEKIIESLLISLSTKSLWVQKLYQKEQKSPKLMEKIMNQGVPLKPLLSLLSFSQHFYQRIWLGADELFQIPHMTHAQLKICRKNNISVINDFLGLFSELQTNKKGKNSGKNAENAKNQRPKIDTRFIPSRNPGILEATISRGMAEEKLRDIRSFLGNLPFIKLDLVLREDEEKIVQESDVTLNVKIRRVAHKSLFGEKKAAGENSLSNSGAGDVKSLKNTGNLVGNSIKSSKKGPKISKNVAKNGKNAKNIAKIAKNAAKPPNNSAKSDDTKSFVTQKGLRTCHNPNYPNEKKESWAVIVYNKLDKSVMSFETTELEKGLHSVDVKLPTLRLAKNEIGVMVVSDCYIGLEFRKSLSYTVKPKPSEIEESESEIEEDEKVVELDEEEKEESLFDFAWYDILTLMLMVCLAYLILPSTDFYKNKVVPLVNYILKLLK